MSRSLVGTSVGSYLLTRELGRGAFGVVYEAVSERLGRRAALKVLAESLVGDPKYPDYADRFVDEARSLSRLSHAGVVQVYDLGRLDSGGVYILMEFLDGEALTARLSRYPRGLPTQEVLRIGAQVAAAMAEVHRQGILHRDLKPSNVILSSDGSQAKIIDFGVARFLDAPVGRTTEGAILGTAAYLSPELCRGEEVTERSDVYSLGVMLYELFSGQVPFDGHDTSVLAQHAVREPPLLWEHAPQVPSAAAELVHEMLRKEPLMRPSMAEAARLLRELLAGRRSESGKTDIDAPPPPAPPAPADPQSTSRFAQLLARLRKKI